MADNMETNKEYLPFSALKEERPVDIMIHLIEVYELTQEIITASNPRPQPLPTHLAMQIIAILADIMADEEEIDWDNDSERYRAALRLAGAFFRLPETTLLTSVDEEISCDLHFHKSTQQIQLGAPGGGQDKNLLNLLFMAGIGKH